MGAAETLVGMRISRATLAAAAASVLLLSGCATAPGATAPTSTPGPTLAAATPVAPTGEVIGQGMVLDAGGETRLCLGGVMESYPPQCLGIPLHGWSWDGLDGAESSADVTWGSYAVIGTFDGEEFTLTQTPVMLALFDPMMMPDPTGGVPGKSTDAELATIAETVHDTLGQRALSSYPQDGYLWVDVVWDDGTIQDAADADFGDDVVIIRSALRAIG